MVSKTKPKKATDIYLIPTKINTKDRELLFENLGLEQQDDHPVFLQLENILTFQSNRLRRLKSKPTPAHVVAALEPISTKARELASLIHPSFLPNEVMTEISADLGLLWQSLTHLHIDCDLAIDQLNGQNSRGVIQQRFSESLESANATLSAFFVGYAESPADGDETEFLRICRKYLPKSPASKS